MPSPFVLLEIKNSRDSEESPAVMEQVFAALGSGGGHAGLLARIFGNRHEPRFFSFEIVSVNNSIHFFIGLPQVAQTYLESQLTAQYPKVILAPSADYAPHFISLPHATAQLALTSAFYYPLKTHKDVRDLDLLASVLGQLAKLPAGQAAAVQLWISPAGSVWQRTAGRVIAAGIPDPTSQTGRTKTHPHARLIETKIGQVGFLTAVRVLAVAPKQ